MEELSKNYRSGEELDDEVKQIGRFGHVNNRSGEFVFTYCKTCKGPMLGHKKKEAECEDDLDVNTVDDIEGGIKMNQYFESILAGMDR